MTSLSDLPWRGPGAGRPELPLPPEPMPLMRAGRPRKRWRYVAAFGPELMLCAARAGLGPTAQVFWAVWDRAASELHERTRILLPGAAGEVRMDGDETRIEAGSVRAEFRVGEGSPVECVCRSGERGYAWTRKQADVEVTGWVELPRGRVELEARGVVDESAGYHRRHTAWHWSAGVGRAADGRSIGWNLVEGINDPPHGSERAVWIDGDPVEPGVACFDDLSAIEVEDGSHLEFSSEAVRQRRENLLIVRSRYRQPFGTFRGKLAGAPLAEAWGVMEEHDAYW